MPSADLDEKKQWFCHRALMKDKEGEGLNYKDL